MLTRKHEAPRSEQVLVGAYLTDDKSLYEIVEATNQQVGLQDCVTDEIKVFLFTALLREPWWVAQPTPVAPDSPAELTEAT